MLFDAVAILTSDDGAKMLAGMHPAKSWVADAFAHCKFILFNDASQPLLKAAGLPDDPDDGMMKMTKTAPGKFVKACGALRYWDRVA